MKISSEEVKAILKEGVHIILDRFFTAPSNTQMFATINRFIKHRHLITEFKKALDKDTVSKEELKLIIDNYFGKVEPFPWKKEENDCENAVFDMMWWLNGKNYPAGLTVIEGHGLLVYINEDKERMLLNQYNGRVVYLKNPLKVTVIG
jgi:hypothetical protein